MYRTSFKFTKSYYTYFKQSQKQPSLEGDQKQVGSYHREHSLRTLLQPDIEVEVNTTSSPVFDWVASLPSGSMVALDV